MKKDRCTAGCRRSPASPGGSRAARWLLADAKEGAHGGTMGSPVLPGGSLG
jgi:hypothetical protein